MSKISFVKYQGAGNDFILIDDRTLFFDSSQVKSLCDRKFGIGADGVILLQKDLVADFRMRIFNCDGTEAESCGNGLRCLMQFIADLGFPKRMYNLAAHNRIVQGDFIGQRVKIQMGKPINQQTFVIDEYTVHFVDTGVPHAVIFVSDLTKIDVQKLGSYFRYHSTFAPKGTNVNFAAHHSDGSIQVRTYERGLETESFACGTAAAAVAAIASRSVQIRFPGGEIEAELNGDCISIIGHAVRVFSGNFEN